ncbi:MAG: hypothetical protein P1P63_04135 [Treponemataceae bacterium]
MKKTFTMLILIITVFGNVFAENHSKPGRDEVVLVFSVDIRPAINRSFLEKYVLLVANPYDSNLKVTSNGSPVRNIPADSVSLFLSGDRDRPTTVAPVNDDIISVKVPVKRNSKEICLNFITYNIFGGNAFSFILPLDITITVPKDAKYLYLGHFTYKTKSASDREIISVDRTDNLDKITPLIKNRYGEKIELLRAPISVGEEK